MNDGRQEFSDLVEAGPPTVQITLEEDRPELVACFSGLRFRPQENGLLALLQAAIKNHVSEILTGLDEEADLPESIVGVEAGAMRLRLAARALRWEFENQGPPLPDLTEQSAAYRPETLELLHGPPPRVRLDRPEREILTRMATASVEDAAMQEHAPAPARRHELQALLDDLALLEKRIFRHPARLRPII